MAFNILITEADRKLIQKLAAHAFNKAANEHEAETARAMLVELLKKYKIKYADLAALLAEWSAEDNKTEMEKRRTANRPKGKAKKGALDPLTLLHNLFQKYTDMQPHEHVGAALWVMHTHVYESFYHTPRLTIMSPTARCGKSNTFKIFKLTCHDPEASPNMSPASMYAHADNRSTVIIDEADNFGLFTNEDKRGIINAGFDQTACTVHRWKRSYNLFAPLAIGGIGRLPFPLMDRSLCIYLERSSNDYPELNPTIDAMRRPFDHVFGLIKDWAQQNSGKLNPEPAMPPGVRARNANKWCVLLAIADSIGPEWGAKAREAAVAFRNSSSDEEVQTMMILDVETAFNLLRVDRISSEELLRGVLEHGTRYPWTAYRGPKDNESTLPRKLSLGDMTRLIAMFRYEGAWIRTKRMRVGKGLIHGYERRMFEKIWKAYNEGEAATSGTPELKVIEGGSK